MGFASLIGLVVASFGATIVSCRGAFASREWLISMSHVIGTKNPVIARIVCFVGMFLFTSVWLGCIVLLVLLVVREKDGGS